MKIFLVPLADLADTGEVGEEGVLVRGNETFGETFGLLEVIDDYGEAALVGGLRYHHLEHCLGGRHNQISHRNPINATGQSEARTAKNTTRVCLLITRLDGQSGF